jgi:hypothetical protein
MIKGEPMYSYNLIIKHDRLDHAAARAMVNQQLTRRFGPDVHYFEHAYLTHEIVVVVSNDSKRGMQTTLGDWFAEGRVVEAVTGYPDGTLLHYREILPDESTHIRNRLGG